MYTYIKYLAFIVLIVGVVACGDNSSTGPDPSEAPSFPEVQSDEAQPDFSFFETNQPKIADLATKVAGDTANYYQARNWVLFQSGLTFAFASGYSGLLTENSREDAEYRDGKWVWEYSEQYENESFSITVTAEETSGGHNWELLMSYDDGETSVEDYLVMEGTVSQDGSEGSWTFNLLNPDSNNEQIAYKYEWTITSDTEKSMTASWYDDSGNATLTASYDANVPEHTMRYTYPNDPTVTVYWNTSTKTGYYEQGSDKRCWDENFKDITCS